MTFTINRANQRGGADHGWLNAKFSFSFSSYHNPQRMGFGKLRVLNDDVIAPGGAFGMHPHANMEIISIVLEGEITHDDSMGNSEVVKEGEVQVMSAGSGVFHSEANKGNKPLNLLQIWIEPHTQNIKPNHAKITLPEISGKMVNILSGRYDLAQNATLSLGHFEEESALLLPVKKDFGTFLFVIEGEISANGITINRRDSVESTNDLDIKIKPNTKILAIVVPMS